MDSFYERPRNPPRPTAPQTLLGSSLVPDASLLIQNKPLSFNPPVAPHNGSYNAWKIQKQRQSETFTPPAQNFKQVRFENPDLRQREHQFYLTNVRNGDENFDSLIDNGTNNLRNNRTVGHSNEFACIKDKNTLLKDGANFENIYLANLCNRRLDLSIIESQPVANQKVQYVEPERTQFLPNFHTQAQPNFRTQTTNKENVMRNEDKYVDLYNYKRHKVVSPRKGKQIMNNYGSDNLSRNQRLNGISKNDNICGREEFVTDVNQRSALPKNQEPVISEDRTVACKSTDDEPTVKDLLKIIQQQNEQLLILQKQVARLLDNQNQFKQIEAPKDASKVPISQDNETFTASNNHKGQVNKFAIGVMTSFEVSIRQQNYSREKFGEPKLNYNRNDFESKITEVTENESFDSPKKEEKVDESLALASSIPIQERPPSPQQSIHVDMQDYSSSESDEDDSSDLGWTIYNNVVGQVNNILEKADGKGTGDLTLRKVQEATLRHLQSIGVEVPANSERHSSYEGENIYSPTEISFAVKQLLMKYLPSAHLAKIKNCKDVKSQERGLVKARPEFSFATVQYMKKYNLIASSKSDGVQTPERSQHKFLDVTALKNQPKLL